MEAIDEGGAKVRALDRKLASSGCRVCDDNDGGGYRCRLRRRGIRSRPNHAE